MSAWRPKRHPARRGFTPGEFSDSLALSSLTREWPYYFQLFKRLPRAILELRTKSVNIKVLQSLPAQDNIIVSYSLSPRERVRRTDLKTPALGQRLQAMGKLQALGHPLAVHFDPVIYQTDFEATYRELIEDLARAVALEKIRYFSLGALRFTAKSYREVRHNYPEEDFLASDWVKSADGKMRYARPMRLWMLSKIQDLLLKKGVLREKIYFCMES